MRLAAAGALRRKGVNKFKEHKVQCETQWNYEREGDREIRECKERARVQENQGKFMRLLGADEVRTFSSFA